ncbi:MAG: hypothetical protein OEZ33_09440 [Gammaproteobacteria bacterium]|nr:hypothetical protein [Gammaproteobacteria bacterium]
MAVGGEYSYFIHDYTATTNPNLIGEMRISTLSVQFKKYFNYDGYIRPFIGVGNGYVSADFNGPLGGYVSGLTLQTKAGVVFQFNRFGITLEYQYLDGLDVDHNVKEDTEALTPTAYNIDGYMLFLGLRIGII